MALSMNLFNTSTHDVVSEEEDVDTLVRRLNDKNGHVRQQARWTLVHRGADAVPALVEALSAPDRNMRWEAAKALGEIADPSAAPALVGALDDERFGVRWLAAEGLIRIGEVALPPLMAALAGSANSVWLRGGAHHVLRGLVQHARHQNRELPQEVIDVLAALEDVEPAVEAPFRAARAYRALAEQER